MHPIYILENQMEKVRFVYENDSVKLIKDISSGIKDNSEMDIRVFPNPSHGNVNITIHKPYRQSVEIEIFSTEGKTILKRTQLFSTSYTAELTKCVRGLYIARIIID